MDLHPIVDGVERYVFGLGARTYTITVAPVGREWQMKYAFVTAGGKRGGSTYGRSDSPKGHPRTYDRGTVDRALHQRVASLISDEGWAFVSAPDRPGLEDEAASAGLSVDSYIASLWSVSGLDADLVGECVRAGIESYTLASARYIEHVRQSPTMSLQDASKWIRTGIDPDSAQGWTASGFAVDDFLHAPWHRLELIGSPSGMGYTPVSRASIRAFAHSGLGFDVAEAFLRAHPSVRGSDLVRYARLGLKPEHIGRIRTEDLKKAARYIKQAGDVSPEWAVQYALSQLEG